MSLDGWWNVLFCKLMDTLDTCIALDFTLLTSPKDIFFLSTNRLEASLTWRLKPTTNKGMGQFIIRAVKMCQNACDILFYHCFPWKFCMLHWTHYNHHKNVHNSMLKRKNMPCFVRKELYWLHFMIVNSQSFYSSGKSEKICLRLSRSTRVAQENLIFSDSPNSFLTPIY